MTNASNAQKKEAQKLEEERAVRCRDMVDALVECQEQEAAIYKDFETCSNTWRPDWWCKWNKYDQQMDAGSICAQWTKLQLQVIEESRRIRTELKESK